MLKIFLSLVFHRYEHTNPSTLMDAKQWVKVLLLLRFFEPSIFYNHRTIQQVYYHHNAHRHHAIIVFAPA